MEINPFFFIYYVNRRYLEHYMYGKKIKSLRKDLSLTQKELGLISGISQEQIARYERGNSNPTVKALKKIADGLNISIDYFQNENVSSCELDIEYFKLKEVLPEKERISLLSIFKAYYISSIKQKDENP